MQKSKILIPVITAAVIASGMFAATSLASAEDSATGPQSVITRIAQKFNLNESDVKAVFDEERTARQAERKQAVEDKLSQAVTAGTITDTQKSAILQHMSEMQANRPDPGTMRSMTVEERQAQRETHKSEMDTWLKNNGLTWETYQSVVGRGGQGYGGSRHGYMTSE